MSNSVIQTSFNAGEWAPSLYARVDLAKYHSGAALLRNFFVDYRGGATVRPGTKFIQQCYNSQFPVRLIPFQASQSVAYILEFGSTGVGSQGYIRFYNNGTTIVSAPIAITGASQANPCVLQVVNTYVAGDWIFVTNVNGMTQLNGNYYNITTRTASTITLSDLNGVPVDSTAFGAYTSGGTVARVFLALTPYSGAELAQLKFAQSVNSLIICHPNHPPYILTSQAANSWTFAAINFGSTIAAPGAPTVTTTLAAGSVNYAYIVTAVDSIGQESAPSGFGTLASVQDIRSVLGTNTVTWGGVTGAISYNVYRTLPNYGAAVPVGSAFGFVGNVNGLSLIDSNITPDFALGPPLVQNPFSGSGVSSITVTVVGQYSNGQTIPSLSLTGGGGTGATAQAFASAIFVGIQNGGVGFAVGDTINLYSGLIISVTGIGAFGTITSIQIVNAGSLTTGQATGANPTLPSSTSGSGTASSFNVLWGVTVMGVTNPGTGYSTPPTVNVAHTGSVDAAGTSILGTSSSGNPTVPGFFQQRLVLAGPVSSPQQFNMSQPGSYFNFNVSNPITPDDAIQGTLVSNQLNTIQSMTAQPQGLIILSDKQAWLLNGGGAGVPISATGIVANSQAYNGASFPPPIVANDNILYVQAKGSIVRDLIYNFYTAVYTGTDISILASHLFYNFSVLEWAWAEEPFKLVWAVRNDGTLLTLTFLKEQEFIAWAHSDTQGAFKSVASVIENIGNSSVDALYTIVQRNINGRIVQYIERLTDLPSTGNLTDAWVVDGGIQYNGPAVLTFSGAQHLAAATVTGLATDNLGNVTIITPFTMPVNGTFTLPAPIPIGATGYTRVTIGLSYLPQLQTLPLDLGEPTVQGKRKKIAAVTLRVKDSLGLSMGRDSSTLLPLQDLIIGNVGSMTNQRVTGLVTGDVRGYMDPLWDVPGQYLIQQPFPYPSTILGVIPEIVVGDTVK